MTAGEKKMIGREEVRPYHRTTLSSFNDSLICQLVKGDMVTILLMDARLRGKGWEHSRNPTKRAMERGLLFSWGLQPHFWDSFPLPTLVLACST